MPVLIDTWLACQVILCTYVCMYMYVYIRVCVYVCPHTTTAAECSLRATHLLATEFIRLLYDSYDSNVFAYIHTHIYPTYSYAYSPLNMSRTVVTHTPIYSHTHTRIHALTRTTTHSRKHSGRVQHQDWAVG